MTKEAGGHEDSYLFRVNQGSVEILHEEDGEVRSEQYLDVAVAWNLWENLESVGFQGRDDLRQNFAVAQDFVPDNDSIVAATDSTTIGVVLSFTLAAIFWGGFIVAAIALF